MFFDTEELVLTKHSRIRSLPPIPETGWRPRAFYPDLSNAKAIGFDVEVKELDFEHGPGWSRGKARIVGYSLDVWFGGNDGFSEYYPVGHEVEPQYNLPREQAMAYLKYALETPVPKFGANLIYDVGNASDEGIWTNGTLYDCQYAEALLNEAGLVDLDTLGKKYCDAGKEKNLLYEWCAEAYDGDANGSQRANIYRASPRLVGPYGKQDAILPRQVLEKQWPELEEQQLTEIFRMECRLIRLLILMRRRGVRIDVGRAEQLHAFLIPEIQRLYDRIQQLSGVRAESTKGKDIEKIFDAIGVEPPRTEKGNKSFTADWLNELEHPVAETIVEIRQKEILRDTFLEGYLLGSNINGRIHGEFHPLRFESESGHSGTRSGRLSSSNPNLQNIPVRTQLGQEIRKAFIPDEGHLCWEKGDFSQIEYRFLTHFAVGPGSEEARQRYRDDPKTDYHKFTQALVKERANHYIPRKPAECTPETGSLTIKEINFGLVYGMGKAKLKRKTGLPSKLADLVLNSYHTALPFVKCTMDATASEAQFQGFITTILGRRSRFDLWEPIDIDYDNRAIPLPYYQALKFYGPKIQRALVHRAINRRLQGSAADQLKKAMDAVSTAGIYDVIGVPSLTVHDEMDHSVIDDSPQQNEAYAEMHHMFETAIPLSVPVLFEVGRGTDWGSIAD